jgi:hypothetical protein
VCGINPSPQALSMAALRRSTTTTSSPARARMQRGGQPRRATTSDEQVDHVKLDSAAFSTLIRVLSRAALSTENTSAVIHPVCTNGSATPSATTAT